MYKHHVILCFLVSISNICLGMEQREWDIASISEYRAHNRSHKGKLQIYYAYNSESKIYNHAARFIPDDRNQSQIKFNNFHTFDMKEKEYESINNILERSEDYFRFLDFSLYISKKEDQKCCIDSSEMVRVYAIDYIRKPEEIIDLPECAVVTKNDYIVFKDVPGKELYKLYDPNKMIEIQNALFLKKAFIVKINGDNYTVRIHETYKNDRFIFVTEICKPATITIDLITIDSKKEETSANSYCRNKFIGRLLCVGIILLIGYFLRNKIAII